MPVVPTYESRVTLNPTPVKESQFVDTSKMFPNTAPDFTKISAAAMAYQKRIDKSRALEAKNAMDQFVFESTYGDNGYLKQHGKNYLDPDENGRGPVQRGVEAFDSFYNDYLKNGKFTASQMELISKERDAVRNQFQAGMGAHMLREQTVYDNQNIKASVDNYVRDGAVLFRSVDAIGEKIKKINETMDFDDQVNGNSAEVSKAKRREACSALVSTALASAALTADEDPVGAYAAFNNLFEAYGKPGYMTAESVLKFNGVRKELEQNAVGKNACNGLEQYLKTLKNRGANLLSANLTGKTALKVLENKNIEQSELNKFGGLTNEVAKKIVEANPEEFGKWNASLYKSDNGAPLRFKVAAKYLEDLYIKQKGNTEEVVAISRFGQEAFDQAVSEASKKGGTWLDYHPSKKLIIQTSDRIQGEADKQILNHNGKTLNPLSVEFGALNNPTLTRAELEEYALGKAPQYTRGSQAHMDLVAKLEAAQKNFYGKDTQQMVKNINECLKYAKTGQDMPLNVLHDLHPIQQRQLRTIQNNRRMGYVEGDPKLIAYYTIHPEEMYLDNEDAWQMLKVQLGEKADELEMQRNLAKVRLLDAKGRSEEVKKMAANGIYLPEFMPKDSEVEKYAAAYCGDKTYDMTNKKHVGALVMLKRDAQVFAQEAGRYTFDNDGKKLKAVKGAEFVVMAYDRAVTYRNNGQRIPSVYTDANDFDRMDTDIKNTLDQVALAHVRKKYKNDSIDTITEYQRANVYSMLMNGEMFDFDLPKDENGNITWTKWAISEPVMLEAMRSIKSAHPNPYLALGRYFQILQEKKKGQVVVPSATVTDVDLSED